MQQSSITEKTSSEVATLAAGCFWGVEQYFLALEGVKDTAVGYTGGTTTNPTYKEVCSGKTHHAEAIQLKIDPLILSFEALLQHFWRLHNPTELNRQGPDTGTQYRSAIFFHSLEQQKIAENSKTMAQAHFSRPIVTEITPVTTFWLAEEYHQKYVLKKRAGY